MSEKANNNPDLLLVDDDKSLLRLLTIRLEGEGYNVTAVEDGQSALKKLQGNSFDVVLSDLRMPGLARMFHKSAKLPPNPVAETSISPDHEIRSY